MDTVPALLQLSADGLKERTRKARDQGLDLPIVYNCGGYESTEALALLDGVVDIFMPADLSTTRLVLSWIAEELGRESYVNLMAQYHPSHKACGHPVLGRRIDPMEFGKARAWAEEAGLTRLARD